jgi:hypothetical protein
LGRGIHSPTLSVCHNHCGHCDNSLLEYTKNHPDVDYQEKQSVLGHL